MITPTRIELLTIFRLVHNLETTIEKKNASYRGLSAFKGSRNTVESRENTGYQHNLLFIRLSKTGRIM